MPLAVRMEFRREPTAIRGNPTLEREFPRELAETQGIPTGVRGDPR